MDKYEYKLRLEEIRTLNRKGRFQEAAQVADTIDWKKVRNITTLGIISDVYKINRRFEDAKEILLLANEKSPQNRRILYSLCDLTIKMGLIVEAVEYYKEFVQLAPNDNSKYILLYKIYEAQDISLEERIAVLKEYKKREYNEKWAYELAFLYHRVGLATACVEECDQLILWFGEGRYVMKAMELKMLYVPLSPAQQQAYDRQFGKRDQGEQPQQEAVKAQEGEGKRTLEEDEDELDIQVKTMDMGQYNTMNLQAALAASMREVWEEDEVPEGDTTVWPSGETAGRTAAGAGQKASGEEAYQRPEAVQRRYDYGGDDIEYQEDVTKVIADSADWDAQATGQLDEEPEAAEEYGVQEQPGGLGEEDDGEEQLFTWQERETQSRVVDGGQEQQLQPRGAVYRQESQPHGEDAGQDRQSRGAVYGQEQQAASGAMSEEVRQEPRRSVKPNRQQERLATLLSQDYDGQISLALPDSPAVEKQITGQMSIEDVLAEWEKRKKENEEKRRQETRQWMLQHTGPILDSFDQSTRDGVLERLQRGETVTPVKAAHEKPAPKKTYTDASAYSEVEELEEIDEAVMDAFEARYRREEEKGRTPAARPAPANAAARAALAAQGVLEEMPGVMPASETAQEAQGTGAADASGKPAGSAAMPADSASQEALQTEKAAGNAAEEQTRTAGPLAGEGQSAETAQPVAEGAQTAGDAAAAMENAQAAGTAQPVAEGVQTAEEAVQAVAERETAEVQAAAPETQAAEDAARTASEGAQAAEDAARTAAEEAQTLSEAGGQADGEAQPEDGGEAAQDGEEAGQEESPEAEMTPGEDTVSFNARISEQQLEDHVRGMTKEERELFAPYVPTKGAMRQLVRALDMISLSAYTGNMIITGALGSDTMKLARNIIREVRASDQNFSGKIAKISGDVLNTKKPEALIAKIPNGALIVEKAGLISDEGAKNLEKALNQEHTGIIVFLLDTKRAITSLSERCETLISCFTARFDIAALDSGTLVKYGCQYAYTKEFSIDELGRLALHTRIENMQTSDHAVTVDEVREIVDEAIEHAERFSPKHFVDILLHKRYDEDDMIVLREKDFI